MNNINGETKASVDDSYCATCLSLDRKLSVLGDLTEIFSKICDISEDTGQKIMICWECKAILGKMKLFRQKARNSQLILSYEYPPSLTFSTLTSKVLEDEQKVVCHNIEEIPVSIEVEVKLEEIKDNSELPKNENDIVQTIKEEHNNDGGIENDYDYMESDDFHLLPTAEDMKEEAVAHTKEKRSNKTNKISKREKSMNAFKYITKETEPTYNIKKISINPEEVSHWREKEKESEYFKDKEYYKYRCESCIITFLNKEFLNRHNKAHHSKKHSSKCKICRRTMSSKRLASHKEEHYQTYMCDCGYQCYTREHMSWHKKRAHPGRQVQCLKCQHTFVTLIEFFAHFREIHASFVCHHCGRKCNTKNSIIRHMKKHVFPTECKQCKNSKFSTYKSYFSHMQIQHRVCPDETTYCVLCDKTFNNRRLYIRHVNETSAHKHEKKPKVRKPAECPECKRVFYKKYNMMVHFRHEHLGKTEHYCAECDRYFKAKKTLDQHHRSFHLGIAPVKDKICSICGRAFSNTTILTHHMRTHTGERPHECQFCDAKFAQKYAMKTHVKHVHLNIKRKSGSWQKSEMPVISANL